MTTIETNNETTKILDIAEVKDANQVDLSTAVEAAEQTENGGKKGKEEAMQHIKDGEARAVANYLENYEGLDNEVAVTLVKEGELEKVVNNLNKFGVLKYDLANILITKGKEKIVAENIKLFDGNDDNKIVHAFLKFDKNSERYAKNIFYIIRILGNCVNLDDGIAQEFIKIRSFYKFLHYLTSDEIYSLVPIGCLDTEKPMGGLGFVGNNLKSFKGLSKQTAKILIESGYGENVVKCKNNFEGVDYNYICDNLTEGGDIKLVIENLNYIKEVDEVKLIKTARDLGIDLIYLAKNYSNFNDKGKTYLENILLENKYLKNSDGQREQYKSLDKNEILRKRNEIKAIIQLNKKIGMKDISFETYNLYPTYSIGKIGIKNGHKIQTTIYHDKGDINKIKIDDLEIETKNLDEDIALLRTIMKVFEKIDCHTDRWKCKYKNNNIKLERYYDGYTNTLTGGRKYVKNLYRANYLNFKEEEKNQFPLNNKKIMKKIVDYVNTRSTQK